MLNIAVLFLNGGSPSTAIQPMEIFSYAGVFWNILEDIPAEPLFEVTTASLDGMPVRSSKQVSLTPQCAFSDLDKPDLVFVPSGGLELESLACQGYDVDTIISTNSEVVDWLKEWAAAGIEIAAVCSGVALLAKAGLLDGKQATAHSGLIEKYRRRFPQVDWKPEYLVTDAGNIYCGGGINAAADLTLYLVEKYAGHDAAVQCAKSQLIEMPRTWQIAFTYFAIRTEHDDTQVLSAQEWLQHHFAENVRFETLARNLGMSFRNFTRRFKAATGDTPLNYLHALRVAMAKLRLEKGYSTIQAIADEVGYEDLIFFRKLFKRHTGLTPNDYRNRFGAKKLSLETL